LLDCAIARIHELDGDKAAATDAYLQALTKNVAAHEKDLLKRKLRDLANPS